MSVTPLQNKTIRPGSLMSYSYYHSDRRPMSTGPARNTPQPLRTTTPKVSRAWRWRLILTALVLLALIVLPLFRGGSGPLTASTTNNLPVIPPPISNSASAVAPGAAKGCAGNQLGHLILVSISQRHLWACQKGKQVYDSPVVTGMATHASTITPVGTYHIYAKQTDTTLTGTDVTGSWSDPVHYWMPFLNNQYGTYGLHDATWRQNNAFGKISPNSSDASHGCVELPLSTAAWLYNWAQVGTAVTIEN